MRKSGDRRQDSGGRRLRPRKRFGQHFLEPAWVVKLLDSLSPSPDDVFVEIGPGRGAMTVPLAEHVRRVVAVEIDRDLAAILEGRAAPNIAVVPADFLEVDVEELVEAEQKPVRVVGNLPYNVSSPILFKLLHAAREGLTLSDATLMLQKEVADRLSAQPGTREYGVLAIQVALFADVERVLTLPPGAFRPPPKVMSAVVRLRFRPALADVGSLETFERVVRGIFLQRRKRLLNALKPVAESFGRSAAEVLAATDVDGTKRPEELTLRDVAQLSRAVL
jgi:16S rRNA (adenine1518-N6/adenine1519-N6)-dimethyltransferase